VIVHEDMSFDGDAASQTTRFDIVENAIGRPGLPKAADLVRQGVLDTATERAVLKADAAAGNAASDHVADLAAGKEWTPLAQASPELSALASAAPDDGARIADALGAGDLVLAPAASDARPLTWWRIDPSSGMALGIGPRGFGDAVWYAVWLKRLDMAACAFSGLGMAVGSAAHSNDAMAYVTLAACAVGPGLSHSHVKALEAASAGIAILATAYDAFEIYDIATGGGHGDGGGH
jgi:hypothetical protein